ncbi:MAG: DUF3426 domain-containing protein [Burkholderiales bacterium]|jgi:predicted Zn finger-like uncharacterized protein|nr:DUF3426 domain-containing protein [Burkholderiales bacterium]
MTEETAQQYTRCPACKTTFRITAQQLKLREGQVRCGRCRLIFNAYASLYNFKGRRLPGPGMEPSQTDTMTLRDFAEGGQEDFTVVKRHDYLSSRDEVAHALSTMAKPIAPAAKPAAPPIKTPAPVNVPPQPTPAERPKIDHYQDRSRGAETPPATPKPQEPPKTAADMARRASELMRVAQEAEIAKPKPIEPVAQEPSRRQQTEQKMAAILDKATAHAAKEAERVVPPRYGLEKLTKPETSTLPEEKLEAKPEEKAEEKPEAKPKEKLEEKPQEKPKAPSDKPREDDLAKRSQNASDRVGEKSRKETPRKEETEKERRKRKRREALKEAQAQAPAKDNSPMDIVLQTQRQTWWDRRGFPSWARPLFYTVSCTAALLALVAQVVFLYHDQIAYLQPVTRDFMVKACGVVGCQVSPYKNPQILKDKLLVITSHELIRSQTQENRYTLTFTLKNNAKSAVGFPFLRLEATDTRGQLLLRRYFKPEEYLPSSAMIDQGVPGENKTDLLIVFDSMNAPESYTLALSYVSP